MLQRYGFYGGIRRPLASPFPSKRFGPRATMAISAMPPPWYRLPPSADDIRGWDKFYLNSPRPSRSDRLDLDLNFVAHPNTHGQNHPTLAFSPKIFSHCAGSPCFFASRRKTLKTSSVFHPHTTNIPENINEATQSPAFQQSNHHGERDLPKPAPTEPPSYQGAGK